MEEHVAPQGGDARSGQSTERSRSLPAKDAGTGEPRARPGPKTSDGKRRVRLNAVRHGLCATVPVIPDVEQLEDWEAHRTGILESLAPAGHLESVLAERVALFLWRLNRVVAYEGLEIGEARKLLGDDPPRVHLPLDDEVDKIVRYEAHLSRHLYHTMHELEALQARRRGDRTPLARLDVHGLPGPS